MAKEMWQERLLRALQQEIEQGYTAEGACLFCDAQLKDGQAAAAHVDGGHGGALNALLGLEKRFTGLTDRQKALLRAWHEGKSDAHIAAQLGNSPSTVRNARFALREQARQARVFLATLSLAGLGEPAMAQKSKDPIGRFFKEGKLIQMPAKHGPRMQVMQHFAGLLEERRRYTDREIRELFSPIWPDVATVRRYMVDHGMLSRTHDGSYYWLSLPEGTLPQGTLPQGTLIREALTRETSAQEGSARGKECPEAPCREDIHVAGGAMDPIVARFIRGGKLSHIPVKADKRRLVLIHIARMFEEGVPYTEGQVKAILTPLYEDHANLRRALVDEGVLSRKRDGSMYWRGELPRKEDTVQQDRRALKRAYKQTLRPMGVYRILDTKGGRSVVGSHANLPSVQSRFNFFMKNGMAQPSGPFSDPQMFLDYNDHPEAFAVIILAQVDTEKCAGYEQALDELAKLEKETLARLGEIPLYDTK